MSWEVSQAWPRVWLVGALPVAILLLLLTKDSVGPGRVRSVPRGFVAERVAELALEGAGGRACVRQEQGVERHWSRRRGPVRSPPAHRDHLGLQASAPGPWAWL